jgi:Fe-S-cluster containining protein
MNESVQPAPPDQETASIHFRWQGAETTFTVPLPPEQSTLLDLLPAAREISRETTALALQQVRSRGQQISCHAGCGACCRQLVAIPRVEAQVLADLVASMEPERQAIIRQRFADALGRLEGAGLLSSQEARGGRSVLAIDMGSHPATLQELSRRYFQLHIPCPFLEDESCSIHEQRPIVCREHHVTTPAANCAQLHQVNIDRVEPPMRVGEALARTADQVEGHGSFMIPLVLSLEFAETHGNLFKKTHEGNALFQTLVAELENG